MTAKTAKEMGLLAGLLVVLGGVVYLNFFRSGPRPASSRVPTSNQSAPNASPPPTSPLVTEVKLDLLHAAPDAYPPAGRDLFRFKEKPPPPVVRAPVAPVAPVRPGPAPVSRPQAEALIRYVGYTVNSAGAAMVTLSVRPDAASTPVLWIGEEGKVIEGRYRLQRITPDAIEIVEVGGDRRRSRIPKS
jgi:hypothetical protein